MSRLFSVAAVGLLAGAFTLATPAQGQAQSPFGFSIGIGNSNFSYSQGYGYGGYGNRSQGYYPRNYNGGHYGGYNGYGSHSRYSYGREAVVHPETYHWTPGRGLHSHGHIHVPSRYGYRTIPY